MQPGNSMARSATLPENKRHLHDAAAQRRRCERTLVAASIL